MRDLIGSRVAGLSFRYLLGLGVSGLHRVCGLRLQGISVSDLGMSALW